MKRAQELGFTLAEIRELLSLADRCPICGMDLEPKTITLENDDGDAELDAMTRRFWIAVALSVPVFLLAMLPMMGVAVDRLIGGPTVSRWIQFALTTPVVVWCGWPFFVRGWRSVLVRHRGVARYRGCGDHVFYSLNSQP